MADWPKETLEQHQNRVLRAVAETNMPDWAPEERQDLRATVVDYRERQAAKKASEARRKQLSDSLRLRLQIAGVVIALLAIAGSFAGAWLANRNATPVVVQALPTPSSKPSPSTASPPPRSPVSTP